jgi:hypothetical protein
LDGFVAGADDRMALASLFGDAGETAVAGVAVVPWPQCEALQTFADALAAPRGLSIEVMGPTTLADGDRLVVAVTTPDYPTYLYVTYLQAGGDAVHLAQPAGPVPTPLPAHSRVVLGAAPDGPAYRIAPPFGHEMIVAIAAASPLFDEARPPTEMERDYLTGFRLAFLETPRAGMPRRVVAAAVATLTTTAILHEAHP